jgi:hypothetical protein
MVEIFSKVNDAVYFFLSFDLGMITESLLYQGCAVVRWTMVLAGGLWEAK